MTTAPVVVLPVTPRTPTPFHGEAHEDVEDWLQHYERIARHNGWTAEPRLQNLYFSLEGTSRHWFENHEASFTAWESCAAEFKRTFINHQRRQRAEDFLQSRVQGPNESVTSFVEDVLRLSARADPEAAEKKLRALMRGVKSEIFGGLARSAPTTVDGFVTEASNIERALMSRASHYQRLAGAPTASTVAATRRDLSTTGVDGLLQIAQPHSHSPRSSKRKFTEPSIPRLPSPKHHRRSQPEATPKWSDEHHQPRVRARCPPDVNLQRRSIPNTRTIWRTSAQNKQWQGRPTCGGRSTGDRCTTIQVKLIMCTGDAPTGRSGFADSRQTPHAQGAENDRETLKNTCTVYRLKRLLPLEDTVRHHHDVQLRRCTDPNVKACRPLLLAGETSRGNP